MHFPSGISISCLPPHFGQVRTPVLFPAPAKGRSLHFLQYALARYPNSYFARNPALSKRRFFQDRLRVALDFFLDDIEHFLRRPALVERNALPFRDFHFLPAAALRASQDSSTFSSAGQGSLTSFSPIRAGALSQQLFRAESCPFQASFFPGPPSCCA